MELRYETSGQLVKHMARMHTRRKGKSGSKRPPHASIPEWITQTPEEIETKIVHQESSLPLEQCKPLVKLANMTRNLVGNGLEEGASTRLLVHTAKLINRGFKPEIACKRAIADSITDDVETIALLHEMIDTIY